MTRLQKQYNTSAGQKSAMMLMLQLLNPPTDRTGNMHTATGTPLQLYALRHVGLFSGARGAVRRSSATLMEDARNLWLVR